MKEKTKRFTKAEWSWIMYDWANSVWPTNIAAAIFPIYFAMKATEAGNAVYGYAVSVANLIVALMAPFLGAIGDFRGMKKKLWLGFLILGVIFAAFMGIFGTWQLMLIGFILSRIGFSGSCLFYDSFLTDVTTPDRMDKVSTWGFAMGYIGGSTIPFVISIAVLMLTKMSEIGFKFAILIVPVWWLIFSIPFWKNVHQNHYVDTKPAKLGREVMHNIGSTLKGIVSNKAILFFVLAYFFYIDGVDTIISMATNYGTTLGLGTIGMVLALVVTQLVAMPFSILFGVWAKKVGTLKMIGIAVGVYALITMVGFGMGFMIDYNTVIGMELDKAIGISTVLFWVLAVLVGTVQGGIQALSRSYFGQLIPPERSTEYYGFLDIFGKFACVIGPALYALFYGITGKPSIGILSIILLFIAGAVLLIVGRPYFKQAEHEEAAE